MVWIRNIKIIIQILLKSTNLVCFWVEVTQNDGPSLKSWNLKNGGNSQDLKYTFYLTFIHIFIQNLDVDFKAVVILDFRLQFICVLSPKILHLWHLYLSFFQRLAREAEDIQREHSWQDAIKVRISFSNSLIISLLPQTSAVSMNIFYLVLLIY